MLKHGLAVVILFFVGLSGVLSQSSSSIHNEKSKSAVNSSAGDLIESLSTEKSPENISAGYYKLATELYNNGEYAKAEVYINKAIQVEKEIKKSKKLSDYYRLLARIQESQKKTDEAAVNYEQAFKFSEDKVIKQVNMNDAKRVQKASDPETEMGYLKTNAGVLNNTSHKQEKVQTYSQMADLNKSMNNKSEALDNLNNALVMADSTSVQSIELKNDIADIYAENKNFDEAINIQKEAVEQSLANADVNTQVQQIIKLSSLYFASESADEGLEMLKKAYRMALHKGSLKEAKSSLKMMVEYYSSKKEQKEIVELYGNFVENIDSVIFKDKSLFDKELFRHNEEKISQLEKEKVLKDELISRKNRYNIVLVGSVLLLILLLVLIVKAWYSIRRRNKRIALQSLRREMNPHFLFNSLNSVNQFIAQNNEIEANKYLTSYSNLMRKMMENSNKDYITLQAETEHLTKYLELEKLRFADKFDYRIETDPDLDADAVMVPNMLIQPNLENAIWHGLRYKETKGNLKLVFGKVGNRMQVIIEDDGIGMEESSRLKTQNQKKHESRGIKNVRERIALLNELYRADIVFNIQDKQGEEKGVIATIEW